MYINKVFLYGNLTRDPELRALPSGQQVASFALATNRTYTNKEGQKQEATEFHNIVAFGRQAEVIGQYLKKGRAAFVEGRIQTRSWEKDGQKQYRTEVVIESFQFGPGGFTEGGKGGGAAGGGGKSGTVEKKPVDEVHYPEETVSPEDIPF